MRFAQFVINQIKNEGYDILWDNWHETSYYVNKDRIRNINDNWRVCVYGFFWKTVTLTRGAILADRDTLFNIDLTCEEKKFFINMDKEYERSIRLKQKNAKMLREFERKKAQDWP